LIVWACTRKRDGKRGSGYVCDEPAYTFEKVSR
jgi:hypothetical protein